MYLVQDDWNGRVSCIVLVEMSPVFLTELLCDWDLSRHSSQTYGFCHLLCMKHQERTSEEAYRWDSSRSRNAKKVHFKPWATQLDVQQLILKHPAWVQECPRDRNTFQTCRQDSSQTSIHRPSRRFLHSIAWRLVDLISAQAIKPEISSSLGKAHRPGLLGSLATACGCICAHTGVAGFGS